MGLRIEKLLVLASLLVLLATPVRAQPCPGDCNGDGRVTIDELVLAVNVALGAAPLSACPALVNDCVICVATVDHLVTAVNSAVIGCPLPAREGEVGGDPPATPDPKPGEEPVAQTLSVRLDTPNPCWSIRIDEVYRVDDELWAVSTLRSPASICIQIVGVAEDSVELSAPTLPIRHFIIGKTFGGENSEPYTFLGSRHEIAEDLERGELIFERDE